MFVDYGMGFGGSVVSLSELVGALSDQGVIDPVVVTFYRSEANTELFSRAKLLHLRRFLSYRTRDAYEHRLDRIGLRGMAMHAWMKLYAALDWLHEWTLSVRLYRIARRQKVDIIHINNGWEVSAARAAHWHGVRTVVHSRGFMTPTETPDPGPTTRYVGISEAVSESIRARGIPRSQVRTVHNPVSIEPYNVDPDVRRATREQWGIEPSHVVAAIFGRVTSWKGQREFLDAALEIVEECEDLMLMIVGDESDSDGTYMAGVQELAGHPKLEGRVVFTGYQKDVGRYFASADIVVHSSVEPEPFGRVVIEGMAAGKPVIAMDEGGPPEIITHEVDGLLVEPRDTGALSAALARLYDDPVLRRELGSRARETVARRFSPDAIARQTAESYR